VTRVRVGVIGCGLIAQVVHLPMMAAMADQFEVVAIADPSRVTRDGVGARYRVKAAFEDWRSLLQSQLDAVVVCSPNYTHADVVLAALDAGLDVLVEKPLCLDPADARAIVVRAAAANRVVQVGYMKRYDAAVEHLVTNMPALPAELEYVEVTTFDPRLAREPFVPASSLIVGKDIPESTKQQAAESLVTQAHSAVGIDDPRLAAIYSDVFMGALIHDVNLVSAVTGTSVAGEAVAVDAGAWAGGRAASLTMRLSNGADWRSTWMLLDGLERFEETASFYWRDAAARLTFDAPYFSAAPTHLDVAQGAEILKRHAHRDAYRAELAHFHACVTERAECRTPASQGELDMTLIAQAVRAGLASGGIAAPRTLGS
jgi:predicted dehydrogenase